MSRPIGELRRVRQTRAFTSESVNDEQLEKLLEVARWTGSSKNTQPWHFIVIRDKHTLDALSQIRPETIRWVRNAPVAIALVITTENEISGAFDEGRLTERLLIAARLLGLGAGTAWFGDSEQQMKAKSLLGIPAHMTARSMVAIGHPESTSIHRSTAGGRKSLEQIVSFERMT